MSRGATGKQPLLRTQAIADGILADDEQQIVQSVGKIVQEAARCIGLEGRRRPAEHRHWSPKSHQPQFSKGLQRHVGLVGRAFGLYGTLLRGPGETVNLQPPAEPTRDTAGDIWCVSRHQC